eukprot:5763022-Amphidinium_carterae.1
MQKRAAQLCFQQVVHKCDAASHLRVKNWCMFQRRSKWQWRQEWASVVSLWPPIIAALGAPR